MKLLHDGIDIYLSNKNADINTNAGNILSVGVGIKTQYVAFLIIVKMLMLIIYA